MPLRMPASSNSALVTTGNVTSWVPAQREISRSSSWARAMYSFSSSYSK